VPFSDMSESRSRPVAGRSGCNPIVRQELFDAHWQAAIRHWPTLAPEWRAPHGRQSACQRRLVLLNDLRLPDFRHYAVAVPMPGSTLGRGNPPMGAFIRDVMQNATRPTSACSARTKRPRIDSGALVRGDGPLLDGGAFSPMTTISRWMAGSWKSLSEHQCEGWLEGYLLTGRHGLFLLLRGVHSHHRFDVQPARQMAQGLAARFRGGDPLPRSTILLTSHVWRQDHNGFSHQDPGFIDHVVNKKADIVRVYLPPDANTLLYVTDECLKSRNLVNIIVAGKQPERQWLDMEAAINHASAGIGMWEWACSDQDGEPDIVLAAAVTCRRWKCWRPFLSCAN
jgi:xylulose-5-phosphate/fructose-6-phosphate phosphoketolase